MGVGESPSASVRHNKVSHFSIDQSVQHCVEDRQLGCVAIAVDWVESGQSHTDPASQVPRSPADTLRQ